MDITRETCKICKSYDFYDIPHDDVNNHDDTTNDDLVYRINVTLHKEGVIVTITACFFVSVIIGVCFKLCKQRRKTTIRTRWVLEMFFSIINIAWIAGKEVDVKANSKKYFVSGAPGDKRISTGWPQKYYFGNKWEITKGGK